MPSYYTPKTGKRERVKNVNSKEMDLPGLLRQRMQMARVSPMGEAEARDKGYEAHVMCGVGT